MDLHPILAVLAALTFFFGPVDLHYIYRAMHSPFSASSIRKSPIPAPGILEGVIFTFFGLMEGFGTGPFRLGLDRVDGVIGGDVAGVAFLTFAAILRA